MIRFRNYGRVDSFESNLWNLAFSGSKNGKQIYRHVQINYKCRYKKTWGCFWKWNITWTFTEHEKKFTEKLILFALLCGLLFRIVIVLKFYYEYSKTVLLPWKFLIIFWLKFYWKCHVNWYHILTNLQCNLSVCVKTQIAPGGAGSLPNITFYCTQDVLLLTILIPHKMWFVVLRYLPTWQTYVESYF